MWTTSKADEQWYRRLAAEYKARRKRQAALMDDMPRRMEILARVKSGEISLREGQRLIRSKKNMPYF